MMVGAISSQPKKESGKMPIQVKFEVGTPTYDQFKAWMLANGWEIKSGTSPEWTLEHGVLLDTWWLPTATLTRLLSPFDVRIQYNSRNERDTEDFQLQKAIEHVAKVTHQVEYDVWLSIVMFDTPAIEIDTTPT